MDTIIHCRNLTRRFGKLTVVDGLDLSVPAHSICGFLGPNGAGKTTTMRLILGLLRPSAGEVEVFGLPPGDPSALARLGALVEQPSLYGHLTGLENVEVTRTIRGLAVSETHRVLSLVGLADDAGRHVKNYSLGMRQRLGVAIAMLGTPDLLILDEPTNGLDPAGILDMRDLIRSLSKETGVTVFLSSHLLAEVEQVVDRLVVIHHGRLKYQGSLNGLGGEDPVDLRIRVDDSARASNILSTAGFSVRVDGSGLLVAKAGDDAARVAAQLVGAGLALSELVRMAPNLERRFLDLVGDS